VNSATTCKGEPAGTAPFAVAIESGAAPGALIVEVEVVGEEQPHSNNPKEAKEDRKGRKTNMSK